MAPGSRKSKKSKQGKLSIPTSNKEYGGNLGLPEKISQREFESTGQFFRRLDRLVAKAKAEASVESRFDVSLVNKEGNKKQKANSKATRDGASKLDKDVMDVIKSKRRKNKQRKHNKRLKGSR